MNDTRHFLRYIMPGILFVFLITFFIFMVHPSLIIGYLTKISMIKGNSIALIFSTLLISGALGYMFATIHHFIHWHWKIDEEVINHSKQIKYFREKKWIPESDLEEPNKRLEALTTVSFLWFERLQEGEKIGNSEMRVDAFSSQAHAAGTARVSAFLALFLSIFIALTVDATINYWFGIMILIGILIILLFDNTYRRTGKISQRLYDKILEHVLEEENQNKKA